jgi:hypothetical protein
VTDPIMLSVASALAGKAAEAAVDGGKNAWCALVRMVRARFSGDAQAVATLELAQARPDDAARVQDLASVLSRIAVADIEFGARVHTLWPSASAELSAQDGGVVNSMTGTVAGHLIQARDLRIEGGLHFGDVHSP